MKKKRSVFGCEHGVAEVANLGAVVSVQDNGLHSS